MKPLVGLLLLCFAVAAQAGERKITRATGEIIQQKGRLQTGSSSRFELELPYLAIVRIGSNADFKFSSDAKKMSLAKGTLLLSMAEETPGVSVESGSVVTSMSKGDLEMSNVGGQVKVITLNGKVVVALAANPSDRRRMRAGDMVDVSVDATSMPKTEAIKLSTLIKSSILFNMGPLPSSRAIRQNATSQTPPRPFVTGGFDPDYGTSPSMLSSIGPAGTAAIVSQMEQGKPLPPPPVIGPTEIPTKAQTEALVAAGLPVPNVSAADSRRILRGDPGIRERLRQRLQERLRPPPVLVATPAPTPRPPAVISPPIATPRPTLPPGRPSQPLPRPPIIQPPVAVP